MKHVHFLQFVSVINNSDNKKILKDRPAHKTRRRKKSDTLLPVITFKTQIKNLMHFSCVFMENRIP